MDDESGEFMERAEPVCLGRSRPRWRDWHKAVGVKQGVDSRGEA